jgi:SAM-dependent methyltransferase
MKSSEEMVQLNREQAKFYDAIYEAESDKGQGGYAENRSANTLTRAWAALRYRQQAAVKSAGIEAAMKETHKRWVVSKAGGDFLEFGCFSGSPSTFLLAEYAGAYLGVELSPSAVKALNQKLIARGYAHKAAAETVDFLTLKEDRKFDLFYAHGVLHHFENPEPLFAKLAALARPDAVLLFVEPSAVNSIYRILRAFYRPFQSDAPWEWPFRPRTVEALEKHFEVVDGYGWGRRSLPLSVMTGLPFIGRLIMDIYIRTAQAEVKQGWHSKVWHNSMVTALYRLKRS